MKDPCKVVNELCSKPIPKVKKGTMNSYYKRNVIDINGLCVIVENGDSPIEPPSNRYTAFIDNPNIGIGFKRLIQEGFKVEARIKLIDYRWEVLGFKVSEPEPSVTKEDVKAQESEYLLGGDY
ncbi:hypothetical protein [Methanobacterium spitsbergense]|uniref:Uncharacterized protein n=1 Tax=Methanobacterium spitsbergense TaxID=2874285 RepID=A0A8T5UYG9_9EURY|nr:hypothetical protein [Methanobacterium spitsbergense]MBZ2166976.1 hypothetical protein [Methanobacterium spitsbergense]